MSHLRNCRRGIVAPLVALMLTVLIGVTALSLDGGVLLDNRRRVQAGADAAALAAGTQLYTNFTSILPNHPDPGGKAKSSALAVASSNGFSNDGTNSVVTVNIPPKTGPFTDKLDYAEVIITYNQPRYFSGIWGSQSTPVVGRAVARGFWGGSGDGVILLDPTVVDSLNSTGGGNLTVTGNAHVIVDSNNAAAAARTTNNGSVTASEFDITGGYTGTFNGTMVTGVPPTPDPLAYLPAPSMPPAGTITQTHVPGGGSIYVLTPGTYTNMPNFTNNDQVILQQASANTAGGIYYLYGCGFVSNSATITMDPDTSGGVMLYNCPSNTSNSQGVSIAGNASGTVNLSALTSGPYAGILFWQDRSSAVGMSITGNGNFTLSGTLYAANANLALGGSGTAYIGSQYISRTLSINGGGTVNINYSDAGTARVRIVRLVE
jgi:hypothetical protein